MRGIEKVNASKGYSTPDVIPNNLEIYFERNK